MKFEVETHDITILAEALNNAVIGYNDIIHALYLGCDPTAPSLRPLEDAPYEKLKKRLDALNGLYLQVEEIERRMLNDQRRANHEENARAL